MTAKDIITDTIIRRIIVSYLFLILIAASIDSLWVIWMYQSPIKGGLGFKNSEIGLVLAAHGVLATLFNIVAFPWLQKRVGTVSLYRTALVLYVLMVALFPIVSRMAAKEWLNHPEETSILFDAARSKNYAARIGVGLMVLVKSSANMVFACNMVLVTRSAPSRTSLGAINGIVQMASSSMRAVGPTFATLLFALSTDPKRHLLGGQLIWVYMLILSFIAVLGSMNVQEGRGPEAAIAAAM